MDTQDRFRDTQRVANIGENLQDNQTSKDGKTAVSAAMRRLTEWLRLNHPEVEDIREQHRRFDFLVKAVEGQGKPCTVRLEVKTDRHGLQTRNLAIELWLDNRHPDRRDGWIWTSEADVFSFIWTDRYERPVRLIGVKAAALRECVAQELDSPSRKLADVPDPVFNRTGKILCLPLRNVQRLSKDDHAIFEYNDALEVWQ